MLAVQEEEEEDSTNVNCWMDIRSGRYPEVQKLAMTATVKCSFIFCMTCVTYVTCEREVSRFSFLIFLDSATGGHHTNR